MACISDRSVSRVARAGILIAEDDLEMRQLVVDCLQREGYMVNAVADGAALLARVEHSLVSKRSDAIDLLLTDLRMPAYSGLEIVRALRHAGLGAPVVVMSAFGDALTRERVTALDAHFLEKPFKLDALRTLVKRLLGESSAPAGAEG